MKMSAREQGTTVGASATYSGAKVLRAESSSIPCSLAWWTFPRKEDVSYRWFINGAKTILCDNSGCVQGPSINVSKVFPHSLRLFAQYCNSFAQFRNSFAQFRSKDMFGHNQLVLYLQVDGRIPGQEVFSVWVSKGSYSILDPLTHQLKHTTRIQDVTLDQKLGKGQCVMQAEIPIMWDEILKYLHNDTLAIHFTATFTSLSHFDHSTSSEISAVTKHNPYKRMKLMLDDEVFTDAAIKVGMKIFKVHKVVLASQSDVFRRMFEADMRERKEGTVKISDISPEVMSDLLAYIYTGTAPNLKTLAMELIFAADKYDIQHLKDVCGHELEKNLTSGSVAGTLLLVDKLRLGFSLKNACINFIKSNSASVYRSDSWKILKDTSKDLALEVMEEVTK